MKVNRHNIKAFTLIEIIIAIAVSSILLSGLVVLFQAGLDSWEIASSQAILQDTTTKIIDRIIEGGYRYDGIREVMEIRKADKSSISWIPWVKQDIASIKTGKKIHLQNERSILSPLPTPLYYDELNNKWHIAEATFVKSSKEENESIIFTDKKIADKKGRIIYYPAANDNHKYFQKIFFDEKDKLIKIQKSGTSSPIIRYPENFSIVSFSLKFLDSTGKELKDRRIMNAKPGKSPISAILIIIKAELKGELFTIRSLVNLRKKGIASSGTILANGSTIEIPSSENIKTLSIIDFHNVSDASSLKILINNPENKKSLQYVLNFELKDGESWIKTVRTDYPAGKTIFSSLINRKTMHGFNLLTIDPSGKYDYNIDDNIKDQVIFSNTSELTYKSDEIDSIILLVR